MVSLWHRPGNKESTVIISNLLSLAVKGKIPSFLHNMVCRRCLHAPSAVQLSDETYFAVHTQVCFSQSMNT